MARVAIQRRMRSEQRKPVHVVFDLRDLYVPSLDRMALLALGSKLAFMDVGVAIGATGAGVGKDGLGMAFVTGHRFVHPAQRKFRSIVVELRFGADRFPA